MVIGIELFAAHFKEYTNQYVLIGGGACDRHFESVGLPFRATKDLDIILIVEALTTEFVNRFWEFIKSGNTRLRKKVIRNTFTGLKNLKPTAFPG